ncbi:MAG: hypothetical protein HY701_11350 [Gemmatimonadetes bacterium]|nr:hypothetical protein [Gemmatimonadota bacterium]
MNRQGIGVLAVATVAVSLAAASLAGQGPSSYATPRTSWGDPDISGFFTNKDQQGIPFERQAEFGDRQVLTEEEFGERQTRAAQQLATDNAEFDIETADRSNAGAVGSATSPPPHWLDRARPTRRTSLVVDPPNGRIPPMTPNGALEVQARVAARTGGRFGNEPVASYTDGSLYDRCITRGLPGSMMPAIYGNSYQIVQGPGFVGIRYEMIHETRIVPLDGSAHVSSSIRQHMGDARGHWEGDTLVVETTNFHPDSVYRNANPGALRLVERFRRVGPDTVQWSVTVDDPTTWTRPWTFAMDLARDDSQPVFEYACHEGNYAMYNVLSGSRAADRAGAEAPR